MRNALLERAQNASLLTAKEEQELFERLLANKNDERAHEILFESHLRKVFAVIIKILGSKQHKLFNDCVSVGCIGLLRAIERYKLGKGARLSTYAAFWIRAEVLNFIISNTSMLRIGTTMTEKKIFFGLRRAERKAGADTVEHLTPKHIAQIARTLGVAEEQIISMSRRLGGESSLNAPATKDNGPPTEPQDFLVSLGKNPEEEILEAQESKYWVELLQEARKVLSDREREILTARRFLDEPTTLKVLSQRHKVSRERIRQIEVKAFGKMKKAVLALHSQNKIEAAL